MEALLLDVSRDRTNWLSSCSLVLGMAIHCARKSQKNTAWRRKRCIFTSSQSSYVGTHGELKRCVCAKRATPYRRRIPGFQENGGGHSRFTRPTVRERSLEEWGSWRYFSGTAHDIVHIPPADERQMTLMHHDLV